MITELIAILFICLGVTGLVVSVLMYDLEKD